MRTKLAVSVLAWLMLAMLVPHLLAGEPSPAVKLAVAPRYPTLTLAGRIYGKVTVRVTTDRAGSVKNARVVEGHPMLREAAVNAAQQWKFEEDAAEERVATLKFSFVILPENSKVQAQTVFLPPQGVEIRQKPMEPAKPTAGERSDGERPAPQAISKT
jgi:TonB family protein